MKQRLQLHHIQKNIILDLAHTSPQRFSDLQPPRVPNNTFSYHVKKLLDFGYIELTGNKYSLTRKALKFIVHGDDHSKVAVPALLTAIYVTNLDNEVLLINRNKRPFRGWYGIPSGLVHHDEDIQVAAQRELFEKTSIETIEPLDYCGTLDFRYLQKDTQDIFVHAIAFIYKYSFRGNRADVSDLVNDYGQVSWSKFGRSHILPEVNTIAEIVKNRPIDPVSMAYEEPSHLELRTELSQ